MEHCYIGQLLKFLDLHYRTAHEQNIHHFEFGKMIQLQQSFDIVVANGAPAEIAVLPNNPEVIISEQVNSSASENT